MKTISRTFEDEIFCRTVGNPLNSVEMKGELKLRINGDINFETCPSLNLL